ncbi:SMR domain-containing protein At5g58720 isoform X2 [Jatropha curcas]|uniref:SMR domain-containing protein At5g58720 isoform X2 n=1 Tax=Jatropha curcas TaxID=180498 RepID=UPI001895EED1|nr:SMR domain-containing protein At5g58720 isoform X2 [Jatropha curcas]
MKQHSKKKKKQQPARASNPSGNHKGQQDEQQETKAALALMEAFDSISLEEVSSACREADGDIYKAAGILSNLSDSADDPSTSGLSSSDLTSTSGFGSSSSSTTSRSGSSEGYLEADLVKRKGFRGNNKQKRAVAVTGTVSTLLGKDYVKASPGRYSAKAKKFGNGAVAKEEAEQFLCSMLSDDSDLSMAVVRDVLCQCGYDVEKMTDRTSDCTSSSAESEVHESIWGYDCRNYSQVLTSFEAPSTSPSDESELAQKVLESLFNISRSSEHEPGTMNWRNVVKKMQSLGHGICPPSDAVPLQETCAKGAEYHLFRKPANQHWDSVRSYYQRATKAYSNGERQVAAYLSDQGKVQTKLARQADERASQDIFKARNKGIENVITIDLHGQHVKQAMKLLKLHLLFGTYVHSIQTLRVITGCGSHGVGKSKLKQSIIELLEMEGVRWSEENRGTVLIKLDGFKEYSFLDSNSDTE